MGVSLNGDEEERAKNLKDELSKLEKKISNRKKLDNTVMMLFFLILIIVIAGSIVMSNTPGIDSKLVIRSAIGIIIYLFIFPIIIFINLDKRFESRIFEIKDEIDLLDVGKVSSEMRAEKQFRIHGNELKRYYDQALKHGSWIFIAGISNLFIGIAIIAVTLYLVSNTSSDGNGLIIGVIGGISGILTNFIAVIFLKMYSGTIKSLNDFHDRLVFTNRMHYSNLLVSKIFDEDLKSKTWAKLALSLAGNGIEKGGENDPADE
jgi:hypothetical protein